MSGQVVVSFYWSQLAQLFIANIRRNVALLAENPIKLIGSTHMDMVFTILIRKSITRTIYQKERPECLLRSLPKLILPPSFHFIDKQNSFHCHQILKCLIHWKINITMVIFQCRGFKDYRYWIWLWVCYSWREKSICCLI